MKILGYLFAFVLVISASSAYAVDYVFPGSPNIPQTLNPGDTLTIQSGTFSQNLSNIRQNSLVTVKPGATINLFSSPNVRGSIVVENGGTANFNSFNRRFQ